VTEPPAPELPAAEAPSEPPAPEGPPQRPLEPAPGFELPSARQVVGRGLQLAYDSSRDLRRASLYIGLLLAAVAGPFALLLLVDLPRLTTISIDGTGEFTRAQAAGLVSLIGPLYAAGALALVGLVTVSIDGLLVAVSLLGGRAAGRPMALRECVARARQVFWRYGAAAFVVGTISTIVSLVVLIATGSLTPGGGSLGRSLLASFVATVVVAPFGYIASAIVIGDVSAGAALRRSITLVRARPRLAITVAAFAFAAGALQTFGISVAGDLIEAVGEVLHPQLDLTSPLLILALPIVLAGLVALGSLSVTVAAVAAAPQVAAFLGLTHYSGGLDRARRPVVAPVMSRPAPPEAVADQMVPPAAAPPAPPRVRWVTMPMVVLVVLEAFVALSGIAGASS
jgi:hypothetical protein